MLGKLNRLQIDNVLKSHVTGRLGCYAANKIYVVPITYAYKDGYFYFHTIEGMKIRMMRANPEVCIEVDNIVNLTNWQSIIAWGTYEELDGSEADEGLQLLVNRVFPLQTGETFRPTHGLEQPHTTLTPNSRMVVFRVEVKEVTGRFEKQ